MKEFARARSWAAIGLALLFVSALAVSHARATEGVEKKFRYLATAKVQAADRRSTKSPPVFGEITASDQSEAMTKARSEARKKIASDYPGYSIDENSIDVKLKEIKAQASPDDGGVTRVQLALTCQSERLLRHVVDATLFGQEIAGHDVKADTLNVDVTVTVAGNEETYRGQIHTFGHGETGGWFLSFPIWQDWVDADGNNKDIRVKVAQHAIDPESKQVVAQQDDVGEFTIRLRNNSGKITANWIPVAFAGAESADEQGPAYGLAWPSTADRFVTLPSLT